MAESHAPAPLPLAIAALTPGGLDLGRRLVHALGRGEVISVQGDARRGIQELFLSGRPLVCVMALGIVVRLLGPVARDKTAEPPVVVVDEAGHFAVSVLGGHLGGANELTREVAAALGAVPVITTASEALGLPALDLVGRGRGWKIEGHSQLTAVAAAAVRGEPVAVYQDAGAADWWQEFGAWPASFTRVESWPPGSCAGALAISDRVLAVPSCPVVVYRPPTLALGVGCRRGVPRAEIEALFQEVCAGHGLAPPSLGVVATASLKADEPGLREFAAAHGVPLRAFGLDELAAVGPLPTPSEAVRARVGVAGVAEPAAMLAAGTRTLLVPKQRGTRVTMAVARGDA
jgi:cobalamin biosynthesis protein CbiG